MQGVCGVVHDWGGGPFTHTEHLSEFGRRGLSGLSVGERQRGDLTNPSAPPQPLLERCIGSHQTNPPDAPIPRYPTPSQQRRPHVVNPPPRVEKHGFWEMWGTHNLPGAFVGRAHRAQMHTHALVCPQRPGSLFHQGVSVAGKSQGPRNSMGAAAAAAGGRTSRLR